MADTGGWRWGREKGCWNKASRPGETKNKAAVNLARSRKLK